MNIPADGELMAILAAIPDHRGRKGRRHSLAAMLAATICGLLTGATGCTAIAQFIRNQEPEFWHALGFTRRPPTTNCYRKLLIKLPANWTARHFAEHFSLMGKASIYSDCSIMPPAVCWGNSKCHRRPTNIGRP